MEDEMCVCVYVCIKLSDVLDSDSSVCHMIDHVRNTVLALFWSRHTHAHTHTCTSLSTHAEIYPHLHNVQRNPC